MPTWLETQRAKVTRATSRSSYSQAAASAVSGNGESTTSESVAAGEVANSSTGVGSTPPVTTPSSTLVQPPTAAVVSSVDATVVSEADPSPSTVFGGETTTATTVGAAVGATTTTTTATAATATPPSVIITSLEQSGAVAGESNSGDTTAAAAAAAPAEGATVGGSPPVVVIPPSPGKRMGSFSFRNLPSIVAAAFSPSSQSGSSRLPWGRNKSKETKNGSDKSSSSAAGSASQMSHSAVNETSSAEGSDVEGSDNDRQQQKQQPQPQQQQQSQQQQQQDVSTVTVVRSGSVQRQATSPLSKSIVTGETGEDEDMDDVEISSPPSMNMGSPLSKVYPSGVGLSPDGRLLSKRALEIQAEEGVHSLFRDASTVASDLDDNGIFSGIVNGKASIALSQPLFENASSQSPAASAMYRHPALASTADSLSRPVALSHRTSFHQLGSTTSGSGGSVIAATTTAASTTGGSQTPRILARLGLTSGSGSGSIDGKVAPGTAIGSAITISEGSLHHPVRSPILSSGLMDQSQQSSKQPQNSPPSKLGSIAVQEVLRNNLRNSISATSLRTQQQNRNRGTSVNLPPHVLRDAFGQGVSTAGWTDSDNNTNIDGEMGVAYNRLDTPNMIYRSNSNEGTAEMDELVAQTIDYLGLSGDPSSPVESAHDLDNTRKTAAAAAAAATSSSSVAKPSQTPTSVSEFNPFGSHSTSMLHHKGSHPHGFLQTAQPSSSTASANNSSSLRHQSSMSAIMAVRRLQQLTRHRSYSFNTNNNININGEQHNESGASSVINSLNNSTIGSTAGGLAASSSLLQQGVSGAGGGGLWSVYGGNDMMGIGSTGELLDFPVLSDSDFAYNEHDLAMLGLSATSGSISGTGTDSLFSQQMRARPHPRSHTLSSASAAPIPSLLQQTQQQQQQQLQLQQQQQHHQTHHLLPPPSSVNSSNNSTTGPFGFNVVMAPPGMLQPSNAIGGVNLMASTSSSVGHQRGISQQAISNASSINEMINASQIVQQPVRRLHSRSMSGLPPSAINIPDHVMHPLPSSVTSQHHHQQPQQQQPQQQQQQQQRTQTNNATAATATTAMIAGHVRTLSDRASSSLRHSSSIASLNNSSGNNEMYDIDTTTGDPITPSRSLWVGGLDPTLTSADIIPIFRQFGVIESVRLLPDKECAFVNFALLEDAIKARAELASNSRKIGNSLIRVAFGKGEAHMGNDAQAMQPTKSIWIGNLAPNTTSQMLQDVFGEYGIIESIRVLTLKNCGFVNFEKLEDAVRAKNSIVGKEINGAVVRVGYAKVLAPQQTTATAESDSKSNSDIVPTASMLIASAAAAAAAGGSLAASGTPVNQALSTAPATTATATASTDNAAQSASTATDEPATMVIMPTVAPVAAALAAAAAAVAGGQEGVNPDDILEPGAGLIIDERLIVYRYEREVPQLPPPHPSIKMDQTRLRDIRRKMDIVDTQSGSLKDQRSGNNSKRNAKQKITEDSSGSDFVDSIYNEYIEAVVDLSVDYIGNIVVQKLFERGSTKQRHEIIKRISPYLVTIGMHKNGTWAVQKIIDCAKTDLEMNLIIQSIRPHTPLLLNNQLGNYVVQCCLRFGQPYNQFVFDTIHARCLDIAQNRFGARAVRTCLESQHATRVQQKQVAVSLVVNAVALAASPNGSLLMNWLLDSSAFVGRFRVLAPQLVPQLALLCNSKLGQTTVLKLIHQRQEPDARDLLLGALFFSSAPMATSSLVGAALDSSVGVAGVPASVMNSSATATTASNSSAAGSKGIGGIGGGSGAAPALGNLATVAGAAAGAVGNPQLLEQILLDPNGHGSSMVTKVLQGIVHSPGSSSTNGNGSNGSNGSTPSSPERPLERTLSDGGKSAANSSVQADECTGLQEDGSAGGLDAATRKRIAERIFSESVRLNVFSNIPPALAATLPTPIAPSSNGADSTGSSPSPIPGSSSTTPPAPSAATARQNFTQSLIKLYNVLASIMGMTGPPPVHHNTVGSSSSSATPMSTAGSLAGLPTFGSGGGGGAGGHHGQYQQHHGSHYGYQQRQYGTGSGGVGSSNVGGSQRLRW